MQIIYTAHLFNKLEMPLFDKKMTHKITVIKAVWKSVEFCKFTFFVPLNSVK